MSSCGLAQASEVAARDEARQGEIAFEQKDFRAAEQHFTKALQADPALIDVRSQLARAFYYDHKYEEAVQEYRNVLHRAPAQKGVEPYFSLSLAALGDCREAIPGLKREFSSSSDTSLRRIAGLSLQGCLLNLNNPTEADAVTQKLLALYPQDPDVLYEAGQLYGKLSSSLYLRLVKIAPHSARAFQVLGDAAASDGRWNDAIAAYRKAVQVGPTIPDLHFHLAMLLAQYSSEPDAWKEALEELDKDLSIAPRNPAAEYEIALIWQKHDQPDKAISALRQALKFDPSFVEGRMALARILSEQNRKEEALEVLEPARKTAPDNPSVHYMLARLYMQLGQTSAAKSEQETFERLQRKEKSGQ